MIPEDVHEFTRTEIRAARPRGMRWIAGLALLIAWCLAMGHYCAGCYHADGRAFTLKEVYKLTRDTALAACVVVDGPIGDATMVAIPGYGPIAVNAARTACVLVRATPDVDFVVVDEAGTGNAVSRTPVSSGGGLQPETVYR